MIALVPPFGILPIALAIVAVVSLFLAYRSLRQKEAVPGSDLLLIASIYLLPLLLILAIPIFGLLVKSPTLGFVLLSVYYWLPIPLGGIAHLFIAAVLLVLAWRHHASVAKARTLLIIYTIVWVLYVSYVVWWYVTKQQFVYL
jgi:hypothetical protein